MTRVAWIGLAAWCVAFLGGCVSPDPMLKGKVIEGKVSLIGAVESTDPRMTGPGIEGVRILGRFDPLRRGGAVAVEGLSGKDGVIELKVTNLRAFSEEVQIGATKDAFAPAREVLVLPSGTRRLLIVLQPIGAAHPGS
jgi:hypothetical protein